MCYYISTFTLPLGSKPGASKCPFLMPARLPNNNNKPVLFSSSALCTLCHFRNYCHLCTLQPLCALPALPPLPALGANLFTWNPTTLKECTKPNRKAASTDPMVVLNAKTIFEDGTYRGVKLIAVKAPSLRSQLARKAKAKEGTASASGDVPVLTDHVLALQGAIGDIRDFATCFKQHFFERMLSNDDMAPSATRVQTTWTKKPRHGSTSERWAAALICLP